MSQRLLLLEDDPTLARVITQIFTEQGYSVEACTTGTDAIRQGTARAYSLLVLDWTVPEVSGLEACRELRRAGVTSPVLMLTARSSIPERVLGLDAGADDYLSKPFEIDELLARARALVRRATGTARLTCGVIEADPLARRATAEKRALQLTDKEFDVLYRLMQCPDRIVSRSELLLHVWESRDAMSNLVEVHVSRLREKLGKERWVIETVRGSGYRFRSSPTRDEAIAESSRVKNS